ncbi:unnamed protein product [Parnassius mnemosyne]|uniref:RNA-directed DNA polymerase n=1 Tax=Parnassius mnemosyne TaxID=213953 RepID=A0AAV1KIF2_9NEOP
MPPKKDIKDGEERESRDTTSYISFADVEKSMTSFSGDDSYPISTWFEEFEDTALLMSWTEVEKLIYAKRLLSGTAKLFLRSLGGVKDYKKLKQELEDEFGSKLNSAAIHKKLSSRKMKKDETYQQYFLHMKECALHGNIEDAALMEYVIDGIQDSESNKSILYGASNLKEFRKKLDIYKSIKEKTQTRPSVSTPFAKNNKIKRCFNCGDLDHQAPTCTKGIKCFRCNEFGHKGTQCNNKGKKTLNIQKTDSKIKTAKEDKELETPYKKIKINDVEITALIDTGSDVNLIKLSEVEKFMTEKVIYDKEKSIHLTGIAGKELNTKGLLKVKVLIDDYYADLEFHVVQDYAIPVSVILGNPILKDFEINFTRDGIFLEKISYLTLLAEEKNTICDEHYPENKEIADKVTKLIKEYKTNAKKKESNVEMKIILTEEDPIYQSPRRLSPLEMKVVDEQIKEWLDQKIIRPSKSDFASPVVLAKKKDGTYRLCIDYRKLNKRIVKDRFPLPLIEDQIDRLKGAKVFTTLDLKNGFMHVNVHEESRKFTAFVTPQGQYEFMKMPFGLCTAPSVFQRYVNHVFQDLISDGTVLAYLDDLILPSESEEEGLEKLVKVFQRAEEYGLLFNWKKCHFMKREIEYLGYIIRNNELRPSKEKISAVSRFKTPHNIKSLQSFLGLSGYFRKFIKNYSIIAKPLTNLLKKNVEFNFEEECEMAFNELKRILCSSPVLRIYDPDLTTELHTDASAEGYGAVLLQKSPTDNQMHPVYYMSKKTTPAERKYHSYYLEILAIVEAVKKFRVYLLGIRFKIVTDCSALTKTLQKKDLPPRVARWALLLEEYNYEIEHRSGSRLKHADALSRNPVCLILTEAAARLKRAQDDDPHISLLKKMLEREPYQDYIMERGILCKEKDGTRLIVVPKKMQNEIIRKKHDYGHFGVRKTEELVSREYYVENLKEKIRKVIDNCVECILTEQKKGKKEGFLHPLDKGDVPLSTYHIDHLGPLTSTNKNYKYIFTVVDGFTKFTWIYPTKSLSTDETLDKLRVQQQTFGSPQRIISDRNAAFTSKDFQDYCEQEGITHYTITTGQPRGNGQVERIHQIIISVISKLSADDPTKWYKQVSKVQRCLNSTWQRSIGMTPFELLFGTKMKDENEKIMKLIEEEEVKNYNKQRNELRLKAKESIQKMQEENVKNYNRRRKKATEYKVDDLVAIKRTQFTQGSKLYPKYLGPYAVTAKKHHERYAVRKVGECEGPINTTTSADLMKPWVDEDVDEYSSESDE